MWMFFCSSEFVNAATKKLSPQHYNLMRGFYKSVLDKAYSMVNMKISSVFQEQISKHLRQFALRAYQPFPLH